MVKSEIRQIINHYGTTAQLGVAMEECSELIQAISKMIRRGTKEDIENLVEEIADVRLCIVELMMIFDIPDELIRMGMEAKIKRTLGRIKEGEKK